MNLSNGIEYLAIPGPSVIPEKVLQAMHRSSPNIYEGELVKLTDNIVPKLCTVARTEGHVAMYIANGHGAWEAALANTTDIGDKMRVVATGRFGHGWGEIGQKNGLNTTVLDFGTSSTIDLAQLESALKKDKNYKAVLVTHVDTSTSVKNEIAPIRALLNNLNHEALLLVDCIASLACDEFHMDDWGVDVMVAACQKGIMVPPGVSFVFFNQKAKVGGVQYTEGLIGHIIKNSTVVGGTDNLSYSSGKAYFRTAQASELTYDRLLADFEVLFDPARGGSNERLALASLPVISYFNKMGNNSFSDVSTVNSQYQMSQPLKMKYIKLLPTNLELMMNLL